MLATRFTPSHSAHPRSTLIFWGGSLRFVLLQFSSFLTGTLWLSTLLSGATSWHVFFKTIRTTIADYGVAASIVIFTLVQFFPLWDEYKVDRLQVPHIVFYCTAFCGKFGGFTGLSVVWH